MKEKYIVPDMEIVVIQDVSIITTSTQTGPETVLPEDELW